MRYCVHYFADSKFKYFDEVEEWEISYSSKDSSLLSFLQNHKDKKISMLIGDINVENFDDEIEKIYKIVSNFNNITVVFNYLDLRLADAIKKLNIPFYYSNYITDWDELNGVIYDGVTSVFVAENLCFEMDKVYNLCYKHNVEVRVFPNVLQSRWDNTPSIKKFFIRPEDLEFYSQWIDVVEFYCGDSKLNLMYEIYEKDKKWFGLINEIIPDFDVEFDNRHIVPGFARTRAKCAKRCMKDFNCAVCDHCLSLSGTLHEKGIIVKNNRKEE